MQGTGIKKNSMALVITLVLKVLCCEGLTETKFKFLISVDGTCIGHSPAQCIV